MENQHILIVDDSEVTLYKLKAILIQLGYTVTAFPNPVTALEWIAQTRPGPDLIISDVIMPEMNGFEFVKKIRAYPATAQKPIIMLTDQTNVDDKIAGLKAGADDYLPKSVSSSELDLRLQALFARSQNVEETFTDSAAKTISVFSLRGGVGTTTISVNLSIAIAQLWSLEVTLLDMSLNGGHCASFLNIKQSSSQLLSSLANWPEKTIENTTIDRLFSRHNSGVKLLSAINSAGDAENITENTIDLIWPYLQSTSNYLVIDAGNHFTDPILPVLERSDIILLVLAPEFASVKSAADALSIFQKLGYKMENIVLVINDIFPNNRLSLQKIRPVLRNQKAVEIPYDSDGFIDAILKGNPLVATAPKSAASLAIISLGYKLSAKELKNHEDGADTPFLTSIRPR
jgi:pilus assembly protein CpaE